ARAERVFTITVRTGAGEKYHADRLILPGVAKRFEHLVHRLRSERVALFRTVDGDLGDPVPFVVKDVLILFYDLPICFRHRTEILEFTPHAASPKVKSPWRP